MSIKTHTFGGLTLTGKDARKFVSQVTYGRPKKAAKKSAERGKRLMEQYEAKGYVVLSVKG